MTQQGTHVGVIGITLLSQVPASGMHVGIPNAGTAGPKRSCFSNMIEDVVSTAPEAIPLKKRATTDNLMASKQASKQASTVRVAESRMARRNHQPRLTEYIG